MQQVATLVEFFSENTIDNVLGAFVFQPKSLIFIIDNQKHTEDVQRTLRSLEQRLPMLRTSFYRAKDGQLDSIREALEILYRDYPDCVFDFTGGSEPMLLTAYAFAFQHDAPMLHINIQNHQMVNIHRCEELISLFHFPELTLEDHLNMNGAFLAGHGHRLANDTDPQRIRSFCRLVLEDQHKWKEQCLFLQMAAARAGGLTVTSALTLQTADRVPVRGDGAYLARLAEVGMLTQVRQTGDDITFAFPSADFRHYLCDSGLWLELYTYLLLQDSGRFSDVRLSVRIGWGQESRQTAGTAYNEIDVIACSGTTPLFISCKSGIPTAGSMNEILVYARKFGGIRAKAAMVTSNEISTGFVGLRKRASDLGTVIVDESDIRDGMAQGMLLYLLDSPS